MPASKYKEPRVCECGYATSDTGSWCRHRKTCPLVPNEKDARIASLEQQLVAKDEQMASQLAEKDKEMASRLATKEEQLAAKDEQMARKDTQLAARDEQMASQLAVKDAQLAAKDVQLAAKDRQIELLAHPTPKRQKGSHGRKSFPEPFRRKIAIRQDWKCANPDGECIKPDLEEYDVDHIIPLHQGGTNHQNNLQALCPACHRRKTEREACMQVEVSGSEVTGQEEVMVAG